MNENSKRMIIISILLIILIFGCFVTGYNHGRFVCYQNIYKNSGDVGFLSNDMITNLALYEEFGLDNNIYNAIDEIRMNEMNNTFGGRTVNVTSIRYFDGDFWVFFEVDGYNVLNGYRIEGSNHRADR